MQPLMKTSIDGPGSALDTILRFGLVFDCPMARRFIHIVWNVSLRLLSSRPERQETFLDTMINDPKWLGNFGPRLVCSNYRYCTYLSRFLIKLQGAQVSLSTSVIDIVLTRVF